ncbi:hypothetical protein LCGC14_1892580 [marine sediment metagenome]|uniref:Uncharacterized protein n=1 Tax=marine sediment metagenome TaxID=412755 RepID=A0A0F9FZ04_9ZZZZ
MNMEEHLDLRNFAEEIKAQSIRLTASLEEIIAEGAAVDPEIVHQMEWMVSLTEAALKVNATAFEAIPDEAAKKQMLELDDALRSQLSTLRKLLELPRREG